MTMFDRMKLLHDFVTRSRDEREPLRNSTRVPRSSRTTSYSAIASESEDSGNYWSWYFENSISPFQPHRLVEGLTFTRPRLRRQCLHIEDGSLCPALEAATGHL